MELRPAAFGGVCTGPKSVAIPCLSLLRLLPFLNLTTQTANCSPEDRSGYRLSNRVLVLQVQIGELIHLHHVVIEVGHNPERADNHQKDDQHTECQG
jgi:hypothetical protein